MAYNFGISELEFVYPSILSSYPKLTLYILPSNRSSSISLTFIPSAIRLVLMLFVSARIIYLIFLSVSFTTLFHFPMRWCWVYKVKGFGTVQSNQSGGRLWWSLSRTVIEPEYPCLNRALVDAGHAVIIDFATNERGEQSPNILFPTTNYSSVNEWSRSL